MANVPERFNYACYLCGSDKYVARPGRVRDREGVFPLECASCGLVSLSDCSHIDAHFYENSQMRNGVPCEPDLLKTVSDRDDIRRFHDFYSWFRGKALLDDELNAAYARVLAKQNKCDTLVGIFSPGV
jgi:hypothetical protein